MSSRSQLPLVRHFSRRWRLQTIFVLLFVVQICTAVGLTGYLSLRNGHIMTELHGGELTCHSRLGEGTKFEIEIPRSQSARSR